MSFWLAHNQLSWNVWLLSSNLIGQLPLSGPSYSSRTLSDVSNTIILNCDVHPPLVSVHFWKEMTRSKISHFNFFPVKALNLTSTKGDQHQFLLTISIHNQEKRPWELVKGKYFIYCMYLITPSMPRKCIEISLEH